VVVLSEEEDCVTEGGVGACECEEAELQRVQHQFHNCVAKKTLQFEDNRNGSTEAEASGLCALFKVTSGECAQLLLSCHQEEEIQRMLDMQLETMMAQYEDYTVDQCEVVTAYIDSGRRNTNMSPGQLCSDREIIVLRQKFQDCKNQITTKAYKQIGDIDDSQGVREKLCEALQVISSCVEEMKPCFTSEDITAIAEGNHQQMKQYLAELAVGKIDGESLDNCQVNTLQVAENSLEEDEAKEESYTSDSGTTTHSDKSNSKTIGDGHRGSEKEIKKDGNQVSIMKQKDKHVLETKDEISASRNVHKNEKSASKGDSSKTVNLSLINFNVLLSLILFYQL